MLYEGDMRDIAGSTSFLAGFGSGLESGLA